MRIILAILFTISLSVSYCQLGNDINWTLEQCIDSALVNNYSIQTVNVTSDISNVKLKNAKYSYLPSLNGGATHGYNWGQTIDPFTNQFATSRVQYNNFYLNSSLVLFSGLQNYYTQKVNKADWQSQVYNKRIEERNLKIQITTAYLQVLLNNEINIRLEEQLKLTHIQYQRISNLIETEREPSHKLFKIIAEEETDKYNVLKSQNDLNYALLLLQQLMNKSYDSNFNIVTIDTLNQTNNLENEIDISSFPELKLSDLTIEKQELSIQIVKGRLYPTLSVNGSLGTGYSENSKYLSPTGELLPKVFNTQIDENFYQSASLSLIVPILNKNTTNSQLQINRLELEQLKLNNKKQRLEIQNKLEQLKMDVTNSNSQYISLTAVVKTNEVNYQNSQIQFENGIITYSRLLEVKNRLYKAQSNLIQSKYRAKMNELILDYYLN